MTTADTAVHVVTSMIDGILSPDDAADWAIRVLEEGEGRDDLDACLYRLIELISLAEELPVEYGGPLYTAVDFQAWLDDYQTCCREDGARSAARHDQ